MKYIIGIDTNTFYFAAAVLPQEAAPDSYPEFVAIGPRKPKTALGKLAGQRIPKLCQELHHWLVLMQNRGVEIEVWVEDYAFVGGSRSTAEIAQCVQAVKDACCFVGIKCYTLNNSAWKLEVVGKGNASKDETKEFLIDHFGWVPNNLDPPDLYDATGVAMAGSRRSKIDGTIG